MKISRNWLNNYIISNKSDDELVDAFTQLGLECTSSKLNSIDSNIIVGEVVKCIKHPNADKLKVCEVDVGSKELLSQAVSFGAVQVPPSGELIVSMADCQTTGGYPRIATVITADLYLLGQLGPGDWVEFLPCDRAMARKALCELEDLISVRG